VSNRSRGRFDRIGRVPKGCWEGLTADQLRAVLASYGIYEKQGPNGGMGYYREDFEPVWRAVGLM